VSEADEDFFAGKRPWSIIKDEVLGSYMSPYIAKVNSLGRPILLIDGYAGPGVFGDGKPGSPLLMCQAAERYAKGRYQAIFINKDEKYHKKLESVIQKANWSDSAQAILGDSNVLLRMLPTTLKDQTVFLYLDPFGLKGCEFTLLEPFLKRKSDYSTEILLTMNMPVVHRLATRHAVEEGRQDEQIIRSYHQILSNVFGGDYWKDIIWQQNASREARETQLIEAYRAKLAQYLPYTGSCPVRERTDSRIKYFIVFASRQRDAMLLLNDIMGKAYFTRMHEADFANGLWEDTDWREMRSVEGLDRVIMDIVTKYPGETRKSIWFHVVNEHFMRYLEPEYRAEIQRLVNENKLTSPTPRKTKRLNDNCELFPARHNLPN
jgi:three-Cys-motif partner protein